MGQTFIDLYLYQEVTVFVVLFVIMTMIMLPVQLMGLAFNMLIHRGKLFMRYEMKKAEGGVTLFQPIYLEDPEVLHEALARLRASLEKWTDKYAIISIVDAADIFPREARQLGAIALQYGARVFMTNARAKRQNLRNSVAYAKNPTWFDANMEQLVREGIREDMIKWAHENGLLYEFSAFHDSDTIPTTLDDDVIGELLRPFQDPRIGGVTTAQRIRNPDTTLLRILDWLEDGRVGGSMAAASLVGQVLCLPGRLYMVRSLVLDGWMDRLADEVWTVPVWSWKWPFVQIMRVQAHAGDDRRMTMRVQELGYRTVMNPRATVVTSMPRKFLKVNKVFLRWATSSQWLTIIATIKHAWFRRLWFAMYQGWLLGIFTTLATIFLVVRVPWTWFTSEREALFAFVTMVILSLVGAMLTFSFRQLWHLSHHPRDWFILPRFVIYVTFWQFIRLFALLNPGGIKTWGSRKGADMKKDRVWFVMYEKFLEES